MKIVFLFIINILILEHAFKIKKYIEKTKNIDSKDIVYENKSIKTLYI